MEILKKLIIIIVVSLILHSAWEFLQCGIFYNMSSMSIVEPLMWQAIFGDVNMTIILFLLLTFIHGNDKWIFNKFNKVTYIIIFLYALALSFYFESSALYTERWSYSEYMPFVLNTNIGLIPVIQLIVLFPLTFTISRFILKKLKSGS
ncbi:hypothetical protein [Cytobacillus sp. IB215316]|uniref:hypothetical protein n=1 Tax=Cytobacillus sp. IB215316 TaxID=3097354 RepID=UPI002A10B764|nr:hypothetical protein [Cytobacillus sp. IB215316]MDX8362464.1 hypothetical protein [Cytobacillus sp. IB215316]